MLARILAVLAASERLLARLEGKRLLGGGYGNPTSLHIECLLVAVHACLITVGQSLRVVADRLFESGERLLLVGLYLGLGLRLLLLAHLLYDLSKSSLVPAGAGRPMWYPCAKWTPYSRSSSSVCASSTPSATT